MTWNDTCGGAFRDRPFERSGTSPRAIREPREDSRPLPPTIRSRRARRSVTQAGARGHGRGGTSSALGNGCSKLGRVAHHCGGGCFVPFPPWSWISPTGPEIGEPDVVAVLIMAAKA
jgi:hypothetical protein